MKKFLKVLMAALMAVSLAACGGNDADTGDKTTFTYAVGGEPEYLDPAVGQDSVTSYVINQLHYPLVRIDETGNVVKEAAKDIVQGTNDKGQMTYTVTLIDGLKWSNGDPVTAEHFEYGVKRAIGLGAADSYYSYFIFNFVENAKKHSDAMSDVAAMDDLGCNATDDKTLVFTLSTACPYFEQLMAAGVFYAAHPDFYKEHDKTWAEDVNAPVTGAYYPTKIDRNAEIVMKKNPNFVHADKVVTENVVAKIMKDMDAQNMAFKTKEIDMATSVNTSVQKEYTKETGLYVSTSIINYFMLLNSYDKNCVALQDKEIRRAIALGIDRSVICAALDAGDVYYALNGFVPKGFPGADSSKDFRAEGGDLVYTDKAAAKATMEAKGYTADKPLVLEYYYNQSALHDTVAAVLKEELKSINIDLKLKTGEIRTFFDDRDNGLFQIARHAMSADYMDTTGYLDMAHKANQKAYRSWGDAHYDKLMDEAVTLSGAERINKLHEAEKYLVEEMSYCIPLMQYDQVSLLRPGITGTMTSPQANFTFWYVAK